MDLALGIIPIESDTNVSIPGPFGALFVVLFDYCFEVKGMFFAHVFYFKVINDERERDGAGFVRPKPWY